MSSIALLKESVRSGTIAALAMMPFGFLFKLVGLRVGHYGPKVAGLLFGEPTQFVQFIQHLVIGWVSALPLLVILVRFRDLAPAIVIGAVYGVVYYVLVNSLALPLFFGDTTPWLLGLSVIYPSLVIHIVFGASIAITASRFVANESKRG